MPGLKLVIPTIFTDKSLPVLQNDAILPRSGALMLLEPGHPAEPWQAGVPGNNGAIPNVAAAAAAPLLGENTAAKFIRHNAFTGAAGTMERTGRGGLHGLVSQTAGAVAVGAAITLPDTLKKYLVTNQDHEIYLSMWSTVTRPSLSVTDFAGQIVAYEPYTVFVNPTHEPARAWSYPDAGATVRAINHTNPRPASGHSRHSMSLKGWNPVRAQTTDPSQVLGYAANWGNGTRSNDPNTNKSASWVFYRYYLEDLTVSGRSFAAVDSLDAALFTEQLLTPGGRYYADTYTKPTI